jgi:hypothetical protein
MQCHGLDLSVIVAEEPPGVGISTPVESRISDVTALVTLQNSICVRPQRLVDWPCPRLASIVRDDSQQRVRGVPGGTADFLTVH